MSQSSQKPCVQQLLSSGFQSLRGFKTALLYVESSLTLYNFNGTRLVLRIYLGHRPSYRKTCKIRSVDRFQNLFHLFSKIVLVAFRTTCLIVCIYIHNIHFFPRVRCIHRNAVSPPGQRTLKTKKKKT